ncbi:MAG TPA: alanine:cation symporter family protein, partial [Planctomycetota bacterium]|nr:alanine:cation symporter family protein [Planctomycetota bacterium]
TQYIFGTRGVLVYRLLFLGFVVLGAVLPLQTVWDFGDAALGLMTVPNLIAILFLSGEVRRMQREYFAHPPRRP